MQSNEYDIKKNRTTKRIITEAKIYNAYHVNERTKIRVYFKNNCLDCFTIVIYNKKMQEELQDPNKRPCIATSETGLGFFQHIECDKDSYLGRQVSFYDLDENLQQMILNDLKDT